ncbi:hypothetical protein IEN85_22655 [Pelagicoccus sp. NFK12]|uniref:Peptidase MA-like domain-containing protein n=1 Tax=Pelagicoccus enzymogenes TaxID=2773457 RepID=A0A927FBZ7_9BACT|nr:hypothetical protein [Pelagicoccus enzymogenes]MBD5782318.1 hypothetical protein [Pelagicoccus enzymogenes]
MRSPLPLRDKLTWPIPDWSEIEKSEPAENSNAFWTDVGSSWMDLLVEFFEAPYKVTESPHFWLISPYSPKQAIDQVKWLEATLQKIQKRLGPLGHAELVGKTPVLVFGNDDDYYEYIANYYDEGEWATSGGIYLNDGYGHFAIPDCSKHNLGGALAHELTHSLMRNTDIPLWLNEGLTQICEESITGYMSFDMETVRENIDSFWNQTNIQLFWNGSGFHTPDETQALSYHLAQLLTFRLIRNRTPFDAFVLGAQKADAGEASLVEHFGISLQELVASSLGVGDWRYRPAR